MVTIGADEIKSATITEAKDAAEGSCFHPSRKFMILGLMTTAILKTVNSSADEECNSTPALLREPKPSTNQRVCSSSWPMADRQGCA
jgi:hypothetical protein